MLAPETRVLLTDALRPPDGHHLDVAVGTTYTLDLTALLLAPLSFALLEHGEPAETDPAALLAAVRQYSDRTTVFCQAGSIGVPPAYRRVLTFAEGCVHEVAAPQAGYLFHPKVWALRFAAEDGAMAHRLVVLSRNLTFDRSWDSVLVLDENKDAGGGEVDPEPASDFLTILPELCLRPMPDTRRDQVTSIAASIRGARLTAPVPFDGAQLLALGIGAPPEPPLPPTVDRLLVISPFLDPGSVRLARDMPARTLVSRPDTFGRLGGAALSGWSTRVLSRYAETTDDAPETGEPLADDAGAGTTDGADARPTRPGTWVSDGLHAKVVVADVGPRAQLVTGSANFTTAAWGGNVEFSVRLEGPVTRCGVAAVLGDNGLAALLEDFPIGDEPPQADPRETNERALDDLHRALAAAAPRVVVGEVEGDVTSLEVTLDPPAEAPGTTRVWPITLRPDAHAQPLAAQLAWPAVAVSAITPFLAVETTVGTGEARVTRRCVLKAELVGDPPERQQGVLRDMLRDVEAVVRYLALLLAEPDLGAGAVLERLVDRETAPADDAWTWGSRDVVLFEPLVRAAVRDPEAVGRIAAMVEELREVEGLLPPEFDALWDVVQQFVAEEVGA